uniref:Uncharacterized protein n=1 Tax=Micrurus lemniscatus lemniscatus TaxID=129467 RepID=A0A2D4I5A1_MICLE
MVHEAPLLSSLPLQGNFDPVGSPTAVAGWISWDSAEPTNFQAVLAVTSTRRDQTDQIVCFKQGNLGPSRKHHSLSMLWNPGLSVFLKHVHSYPIKNQLK